MEYNVYSEFLRTVQDDQCYCTTYALYALFLSAFCQPTWAYLALLSSQHLWPSGFFSFASPTAWNLLHDKL